MLKLPKIFQVLLLSIILIGFFSILFPPDSYAQTTTGWVKDQEVTFVGKTAARANGFLEWALSKENYKWIILAPNQPDPIIQFWEVVRNIVFAVLVLFILGAAFVMIITRGQNLTVMRFIPRFLTIMVLVFFSFALIRFLYQATDVVQGFFLSVPDPSNPTTSRNISPEDLLYVDFNYEDFTGYRLIGIDNDESAFISLLLVKLTAVTYYVMTGLLVIRKIILWFFIIVSPIFPVLLFFRPVRNTAKIWLGEFFRWLLYAPLFALFLNGLVKMWRTTTDFAIPLDFNTTATGIVYPTAINILLGGPGQTVSQDNSVNLPTTFALYVVALIMLWVVVLLPFLLLQIFLDYLNNAAVSENSFVKNIMRQSWFNKAYGGNSPPPPPVKPPHAPAPYGLSKSLPVYQKRQMQIPTGRSERVLERAELSNVASTTTSNIARFSETRDMLRLTNLTIPKMSDIARFETSMLSNNALSKQEIKSFNQTLEKIATPTIAAMPIEKERFLTIKEKLVDQGRKGDSLALSILNASKITSAVLGGKQVNVSNELTNTLRGIANPTVLSSTVEKEKITEIKEKLVSEKERGNTFASQILETTEKITNIKTSEKEKETLVKDLREKLVSEKAKGNALASEILSASNITTAYRADVTGQLTKMLIGISNPELLTPPAYMEKIKKLRETLLSEKEKGDTLASIILESSEKVANPEVPQSQKETVVENLMKQLEMEREKGNSLAISILPSETTINSKLTQVLRQIARPEIVETKSTIEKITSIREKLISEKAKGNLLATTILTASEKVASDTVSQKEKEVIVEKLKETLISEKQRGNVLASEILPEEKTILQSSGVTLPTQNKVQQVSIEEYEDVKRMWIENYQNLESPVSPDGKSMDKHEYISSDIDSITETINLLSSDVEANVNKGMNNVANILPFLLLGGFSKTEVISYLKAKLEAAKTVLSGVASKKDEDETMVDRETKKTGEAQKEMKAEIPIEKSPVSVVKPISNEENNGNGKPSA